MVVVCSRGGNRGFKRIKERFACVILELRVLLLKRFRRVSQLLYILASESRFIGQATYDTRQHDRSAKEGGGQRTPSTVLLYKAGFLRWNLFLAFVVSFVDPSSFLSGKTPHYHH